MTDLAKFDITEKAKELACETAGYDSYERAVEAAELGLKAGLELAAKIAKSHADDRNGRDKNFHWNDGYQDACTHASAAILYARYKS